ncbi:MAG: glycosyltransferase family 2 protein [Cyclobacteriaceae bacterium]
MDHVSPSVSILLPFYNAEHTLPEAVNSLLGQTFTDFELLLINNCSSDGSEKMAAALATKDARIRLLSEEEQGITYALNTGLKQAKGKYIARMDADDISYPDRLALQFHYLEAHPQTDVLACQVDFSGPASSEGIRAYIDWNNRLLSYEQMYLNRFVDAPLIHPSVMFRKTLIKNFGGYRQGDFPEDFELWLRWMEAGVHFAKYPQPLLCWKDHPQRLTRQDERYSQEAFYRIKSHYLARWLRRHNPFHPEIVVWGAGRKSRQRLQWLQAAGIQIRSYIDINEKRTSTRSCIHFEEIAPPGAYFILSNVAKRGRGEDIRQYLMNKGYTEGVNFLMMA